MDLETYEQTVVNKLLIKDVAGFMKEEMEVKLTIYNDEPIDIELPVSVDLKVIEAENAVRGDTATGVTKKVKLETGAEVSVPYFINTGDTIRVDTRNGGYVTRVTN
jgi:elongation factor P